MKLSIATVLIGTTASVHSFAPIPHASFRASSALLMAKEYLDPDRVKCDGHVFLGLSLSQYSERGHPDSPTHQTAFDLNEVQDRDYEYLLCSNDDGWLLGGGEPGYPKSYKLEAKDSSHVEMTSFGTFEKELGGVPEQEIIDAIESGKILIPQIEVVPTSVFQNPDTPPELELRFDMGPYDPNGPLPINWPLRFVHNQLFKHFEFPARFCPGPFHSTFVRKAEFRSEEKRDAYFEKVDGVIQKWLSEGPKPLQNGARDTSGNPVDSDDDDDGYHSGLWLFLDRDNITHYFKPNFLPPYDTPEKRKIIDEFLKIEWDADNLLWKPTEIAVE